MTMGAWTAAELAVVDSTDELSIAVRRPDGTHRPAVPIWTVATDGQVFVRTWYRRDTGWFGHAVIVRRARIAVSDVVADVEIDDVGSADSALRDDVDRAYRAKYSRYGPATVDQMTSDAAAAATLRLIPDRG